MVTLLSSAAQRPLADFSGIAIMPSGVYHATVWQCLQAEKEGWGARLDGLVGNVAAVHEGVLWNSCTGSMRGPQDSWHPSECMKHMWA